MPQNNLITIIPEVNYLSYEQMNTIITFQKIWIDLAFWNRNLLISTFFNLPNLLPTTNQFFNITPQIFYNSLRFFYGPEISQYFLSYFTSFLASNLQLINAYKSNDEKAINDATTQWYLNADTLSEFFSRINIYWDVNQWKNLLYQYIRLKIVEAVAVQSGDHNQEMGTFYKIQDLSQVIGSYMARGIIAQFLTRNTAATGYCYWGKAKE